MGKGFRPFSTSSLRNDTLFYGVSTLSERVISFLLLPLLTKSIAQELYGVWSQIIITAALVSNIILMGFHTAVVRFLPGRENNRGSSEIFHGMMAIVLLNSFIVILIAFLFASPLSHLIFSDVRYSNFIPLLGFFLVSETLFELVAAFLRARKSIQLVSLYYFMKAAVRIGLLAIGILIFRLELYQAITVVVSAQLILILFIYVKDILKKVGLRISVLDIPWGKIMFFSLPLVPYGILIWANNFVDRYFILHILDITQVSIYAVAYSLAAIAGLSYSVLGYTLYPYLTRLWNAGDKIGAAETLHKVTEYYLFCTIPVITLLANLGAPFVRIFAKSEYISNWQVVFFLGAGIGSFGLYQLNLYIILLANKTLLNLKVTAICLFVNVIFNTMLIPMIGILGAAIATFLSNSILAFWIIRKGKKYLPYVFPWRTMIKIVVATSIMMLVLLMTGRYVEIRSLGMLILIFSLGAGIYGTIDLLNKNSLLLRLYRNI
jgi:O-antigen/teichoic acid export membrane protein